MTPPRISSVRVVCTDRGEHPARVLGFLGLERDRVVFLPWQPREEKRFWGKRWGVYGTMPLRCPTCQRDVPLSQESAERILAAYIAAGRQDFEISSMP